MDPLSDMLTIIRNGLQARHQKVSVPFSKLKMALLEKISQEGFVNSVKETKEGSKRFVEVHLRYRSNGRPMIQSIARVSKSGRRVYRGYDDMKPVRSGIGISLLTTSHGIMTDREAKKAKVGGEVVIEIY